jgi:hypothetical protein
MDFSSDEDDQKYKPVKIKVKTKRSQSITNLKKAVFRKRSIRESGSFQKLKSLGQKFDEAVWNWLLN